MTELDVLRRARERLAEPGRWTKRSLGGWSLGSGCLTDATCGTPHSGAVWLRIARHLGLRDSGCITVTIGGWNDAPERIHADVLTLLDDCIAELEEHEGVEPTLALQSPQGEAEWVPL